MSQDKLKKLQCTKCKHINYRTTRRIKGEGIVKLELKKYCNTCRKMTVHKEMKK
jgi:large subunit ribosomal protein L33